MLYDALTAKGLKVGLYTGGDKSGLEGFLEGDVDVEGGAKRMPQVSARSGMHAFMLEG